MNPEFCGPPDRRDDDRISAHVCRAVGAADFDYATLVDGVHHRAARIRRRRALTTGAIVAVFGPALLGGSAMVLPGLLPGGIGGTVTPAETPLALLTDESTQEPTTGADGEATGDAGQRTTAAEHGLVQDPPWQDGTLPLPAGGLDDANSDNAWDVPDARPTGVDHLDALGAPQFGNDYRQVVPVSGPMACDHSEVRRGPDPEPLAGQGWMYFHDDVAGEVNIQVTGWEDSAAARDALRDNTMTYCYRDTDGDWEQLVWAEHQDDDDFLLYEATSSGIDYRFAVVRQGDYLIGVSVSGVAGAEGGQIAAEIASKTADNMQALDPIHGRD